MRVLITGGSGLLGRALIETRPEGIDLEATWYTNHVGYPMAKFRQAQLDVTDKSQIRYLFDRTQPEVIIHTAANGSVDFAENNYLVAHQVNTMGTDNILQAAKDYQAKVVYISTNAVFDGNNPPYSEESECHPVNAYGKLKRLAEEKVLNYKYDWLIIRPFLLYGWSWPGGRQNWATLVINKLSKGESLKLVDDVVWQPTYVQDCAEVIWTLLCAKHQAFDTRSNPTGGIYQVASDERVNLYDFGLKVAQVFELDSSLLEPVGSDYFSGMAPRPKDTTYKLDKIKEALGIGLDGIRAGLERMKNQRS